MVDKVKLSDAYALRTPEDNRALYARWADTYDSDFAEGHKYAYHVNICAAYLARGGATNNVVDVGCGTGLVGEALASEGVGSIHGMDISPAMLEKARQKVRPGGAALYERLHEADLTGTVAIDDGSFDGVISAGAFTHGHLGPESLDEVVRMAAPRALLAIGVNAQLFSTVGGFGEWMENARLQKRITDVGTQTIAVYAGGELGAAAADDLGTDNAHSTVMLFQKA